MDSQTRGLLRECSAGCKMAINSFNQIRDYVTDEKLKDTLDVYDKKHKEYEEKTAKLLTEAGSEEKEPGVMAAAMSRLSTDVKLLISDDTGKIAKMVMDGCNMGIQSLGASANQYKNASRQSLSLAKDMIRTEENLMKEIQAFL